MSRNGVPDARMLRMLEDASRTHERLRRLITPEFIRLTRTTLANLHRTGLPKTIVELNRAQATVTRIREALPPSLWEGLHQQAATLANATRRIGQVLEQLERFGRARQEALRLFTLLPDPRALVEHATRVSQVLTARAEHGEQALANAGYGFTDHLWDFLFLAALGEHSPAESEPQVTNRMLAVTRGAAFAEELRELFESSTLLARRWKIVARALRAHRERDYIVSVPLLLAQTEGVINDALVLRDLAIVRNGKVYARGVDGRVKLNKNDDPVELKGLGSKVNHYRFNEHEILRKTTELLAETLIPNRNHILHGSTVRYDQAKLSTQALLLILVLANVVAAVAPGDGQVC